MVPRLYSARQKQGQWNHRPRRHKGVFLYRFRILKKDLRRLMLKSSFWAAMPTSKTDWPGPCKHLTLRQLRQENSHKETSQEIFKGGHCCRGSASGYFSRSIQYYPHEIMDAAPLSKNSREQATLFQSCRRDTTKAHRCGKSKTPGTSGQRSFLCLLTRCP